MKKGLKSFLTALTLTGTIVNFAVPSLRVNAETLGSVNIKHITANTYVGDVGQVVDSFEIVVDDIAKIQGIKAEDFEIINNYDGYPLNSKGELALENYEDDGISLSIEGNTIKMDVKDFKYDSSMTGVFSVVCDKYPELNFTSSNVNEIKTQTVDKFENLTYVGTNGVKIPYRLYSANTGKPEPLVIWMHGAGEVGTDNIKPVTANRGAVAFAESEYTTNVMAAQYPYKYSVELTDTELKDMRDFFDAYEELINKLIAEGKVDSNRIYLTGASMGGGLTLRFLLEKPNLFTASVAIASRGTVKDLSELSKISKLPIWLFHAEEDTTNASTISKNIYNKLKELGNDSAKMTIYSTEYMNSLRLYGGLLHWSWVPTLNNKDMISWLYSQSKQVVQVKDIVADTYIGDAGTMVQGFDITVNDASKLSGLKASDFDIKGNYDGYPLDSKGNLVQNNYADDEIKLSIEGNTVKLRFKGFKYPGGVISPFSIICSKYPELSFNQSNVSKVNIKTVDEFVAGTFVGSNGQNLTYKLKSTKSSKPEPLVVWLHGGGEVGTDGLKHLTENRGATTWTESGKETSVLSVQFPKNYGWAIYNNPTELKQMQDYFTAYNELIQKLISEGKVDKNRVYVVGASSGGGGVFRFMMQYPDLFAGAISIAAKDTIGDYKAEEAAAVADFKEKLKGIKDIPIWIVHADGDPICDSRTSKYAYKALIELGSTKAKETIYSNEYMDAHKFYEALKHWSWVPVFNNDQGMIDWLFEQTKAVDDNKSSNPIVNKDGVNKIVVKDVDLTKGAKVEIEDVQSVKDGKGSFEIVAENTTIKLPFSAIDDSLLVEGSKIVFELNVEENSDIVKNLKGNKKVYNFNLYVVNGDSKTLIHKFNDGEAEITITLTDEEISKFNKDKITVFYYNEETKSFESLKTSLDGNSVTFKTPHFSKYVIGEATNDSKTGLTLPQTGAMVGMNSLLGISIILIALGFVLVKKRAKV